MPREGAWSLVEEDAGPVHLLPDAGARRWAGRNSVRAGELRAGSMVMLARTTAGIMRCLDRGDPAPLTCVQHGECDRDAQECEAQSGGDAPSERPARRYDR